jgi:uncharacterized delta-60 repeat protein
MEFAAVRLNTNGALDQSFGHGGIANVDIGPYSLANAVLIQPDGKIVLAGTTQQDHIEFAAARLNRNGTLDSSFGQNGTVTLPDQTGGAWAATLQSDGKIVLAGQADYDNPPVQNAQQFMAARLNPDGTLDTTFAQNGIALIPVGQTALGFGIAQENNGKLLLAGIAFTFTNANATVQLNPDGTLDSTYANNGIATVLTTAGANGLILDPTGRAIIPIVGPGAERVNPDGTADTTFATTGIALIKTLTGGANGAALQPDGKIIIAGAVKVNGRTEINVVRLNGQATAVTVTQPSGSTPPVTQSSPPPGQKTSPKAKPVLTRSVLAAACVRRLSPHVKQQRSVRHRHTNHKRRRRTRHRRAVIKTVQDCWH